MRLGLAVEARTWHYRCPVRNAPSAPSWAGRVAGITILAFVGAGTLTACEHSGANDAAGAAPAALSTVQTEQEPASSASAQLDTRASSPSETLLPTAPPPYSTVGTLAPGFPANLLPVPKGAEILVSSAVPIGDNGVHEISLNLRSPDTAEALMSIYRSTLSAAGFQEVAPAAVQSGLAEETTFTRSAGDEILVVGILDQNDARTVTIGGRVRVSK